VERDPGFALAWTELSVAHMRHVGWGLVPAAEGYAQGRAAVERSLELEPGLADGHAQIAWIRIFYEWDWRGAEASLARALEAAPGSAAVMRLSGVLASALGRPNEAISMYRRALEQDPLSAAAYHSLGLALQAVDDSIGADEAFRKAVELGPQRIATHAHLALTALARGRSDEAVAEAMVEPEEGYRLWALAIVHHALANEAESADALQRLMDRHADLWALQIAEVQVARGDVDAGFEWLHRAHAKRDVGLAYVKTSPRLRAVHGDARWRAFLHMMGFD